MQRFLDDMEFGAPFDAEFGPDGSLYMIEFGSNNFSSTVIPPSIVRIDYVEGNRVPLVEATSDVDSGAAPLQVTFDASGTTDPDGDELSFSWDFDGDGTADAEGAVVSHTFTETGEYAPRLTVTDEHGAEAIANLSVVVGNTRPVVEFVSPTNGGFAEFSEEIHYEVRVIDPEEGEVDCTDVVVTYALGHDTHAHPTEPSSPGPDCTGTVTPVRDGSHGNSAYVYHVVTATYTDGGGVDGTPALTGHAELVQHSRLYQAQHTQAEFGTIRASAAYNMSVANAWLMFPAINLDGIERVNFEVSGQTDSTGGNWVLRAGSPDGPVVARYDDLPDTGTTYWGVGGDARYVWLTAEITDPGGVNDLYVTVEYPEGTDPGRVTLRNFEFISAPSAVTATLDPATPNGDNGWYTSAPTVTVSDEGDPADQWTPQVSLDGQTWDTAPAVVDSDGAHEVRYRVVDRAGVTAGEGSLDVRVDRAAPTVTVSGLSDGAVLGDSRDLSLAVNATDLPSGVAAVTATLDGTTVSGSVPLWQLDLGDHEIVVTARDRAGNTTTRSLSFTTTTSLADVRALLGRFAAEGRISAQARNVLEARLRVAESRGDRLGDDWATRMLELFADAVTRHVDDAAARRVLLRDADALIDGLDS